MTILITKWQIEFLNEGPFTYDAKPINSYDS
jgi:hypothetical protein